jgi:hypothetical protein
MFIVLVNGKFVGSHLRVNRYGELVETNGLRLTTAKGLAKSFETQLEIDHALDRLNLSTEKVEIKRAA